jgi:hypothetical protein
MKDEGCAKDYMNSATLEGLEKRKYIAELVTYGCAIQLRGFYIAHGRGLITPRWCLSSQQEGALRTGCWSRTAEPGS